MAYGRVGRVGYRELSILYTLNEKQPSASTNPVTNQGLIDKYSIFVLPVSSKIYTKCLIILYVCIFGLYLRLI